MLLYTTLASAHEYELERAVSTSSHTFTAVVEAVVHGNTAEGWPYTEYGLRVSETFVGRVTSGYVVVRTHNGLSGDGGTYGSSFGEIDLGLREELLVFGSLDAAGRLTVTPSGCMAESNSNLMFSKRVTPEGLEIADRVDTGGRSRAPIGARCASGVLVNVERQELRCVWNDLVTWMRSRDEDGPRTTVPGDPPLPPGLSGRLPARP